MDIPSFAMGLKAGGRVDVDPEVITEAVRDYLDDNPVEAYDDAKIRGEIGALNRFDISDVSWTEGRYFGENGNSSAYSTFEISDYIRLAKVDGIFVPVRFKCAGNTDTYCVLYDKNKVKIGVVQMIPDSGIRNTEFTFVVDDPDVAFVRLSNVIGYEPSAMFVKIAGIDASNVIEAADANAHAISDSVIKNIATHHANLFNRFDERIIDGKYAVSSKYLDGSGYSVTHPIALEAGKTYCASAYNASYGTNAFSVFGVDGDGNPFSGNNISCTPSSDETYMIITPSIDMSVRANVPTRYKSSFMFIEGETMIPYDTYGWSVNESAVPNVFRGKKIAVFGDSIMYGAGFAGGFAKIIADENNMQYQNIARGGSTIAYGTTDSSGNDRGWICEQASRIDHDADYILFNGGVNDSSETPVTGSITSGFNETLHKTTFCGAMEHICKTLVTDYAGAKVGYVIVHKMASNYTSEGSANPDKELYALSKRICEKWGVPYIDLNVTVPPLAYVQSLRETYTANADGWHPNELGYKTYYVPKITEWMKGL